MLRRSRRQGSHALEFALCLPIWLTALALVFELGWLAFHKTSLEAAANEGCRVASFLDPGSSGQNIATLRAVAEAESLAALQRLTGLPCADCQHQAVMVDLGPTALRCEMSRSVPPLVGLALGPRDVHSVQVALLQTQY